MRDDRDRDHGEHGAGRDGLGGTDERRACIGEDSAAEESGGASRADAAEQAQDERA
jgi:hypothetical protein